MRYSLRTAGALAVLVALVFVLLATFLAMDQARGQPATIPPTPAVLLSNPPVARPTAVTETPKQSSVPSGVVEPTWQPAKPPPRTTDNPAPTPTPRPATGGPYITEAKAVDIAVQKSRYSGEVNAAVPPRAVFTAAKNVPALIDKPSTGSVGEREYWVVFLEGHFRLPRTVPGAIRPDGPVRGLYYGRSVTVIDATTGDIDIWGLRNELP